VFELSLPEKDGRVWYEADIDYESGFRNTKRIVFSNDGLIFFKIIVDIFVICGIINAIKTQAQSRMPYIKNVM